MKVYYFMFKFMFNFIIISLLERIAMFNNVNDDHYITFLP